MYDDIGLQKNRKVHHILMGNLLCGSKWLSECEITIFKHVQFTSGLSCTKNYEMDFNLCYFALGGYIIAFPLAVVGLMFTLMMWRNMCCKDSCLSAHERRERWRLVALLGYEEEHFERIRRSYR